MNKICKKELMIAEADSFWTKRFIDNVSLKLNHNVTLLTPTNTVNKEFYSDKGIHVVETMNNETMLDCIPKVRTMIRNAKIKKYIENADYDILHVNYASSSMLDVITKTNNVHNLYITYWGSDLLRATTEQLKKAKGALKKADNIVVMTSEMANFFANHFDENLSQKVKIIDMGVTAFDSIDRLRGQIEMCRDVFLKGNMDKTIITIAYNADINQQHLQILNVLNKLPEDLKERYHLILPMTYRKIDKSYISNVKKTVENTKIDYTVLEDFMNDDEIAKLCLATDVFINAQTTDAQSTSMIEHLYANTVVLNGKWLNYSFLTNHGIICKQFEDFDELYEILKNQEYLNQEVYDTKLQEILYRECSWDSCKTKWGSMQKCDAE